MKPDFIDANLFDKWYNSNNPDYLFVKHPLGLFNLANKNLTDLLMPDKSVKFIGYFKISFTGVQYDNYIFNPVEIKKDFQYIRSKIIRYKEVTTAKIYHCILAKSNGCGNLEIYDPMGGNWIKYFPNSIGNYTISKITSDIYPQQIESQCQLRCTDLSGYCQTWCLIYIYQMYFNQNLSILEWISQYYNKSSDELRKYVTEHNLLIRQQIKQSEITNVSILTKKHEYDNRQQALEFLIKLL